MKNILFILHLPPPVHGAAMMGKYIKDSKCINEAFDCHFINLATASGLEDIGKVGVGKAVRYLKLLQHVRQKVKRLHPSLVYVTPNAAGAAFYKDYVLVQMLKRMGCHVVCHYHNKGVASRQGSKLDNWLYKRFFRGVKVILLAEALYKDVAKYVSRDDVTIVPNGIPDIMPLPEKQHSNDVPQLLFLSNLIESKGVIDLLDACKILKERGCKFVCNFVGGETSEINAAQFAEEVAIRGIGDVVIYKGRKYGEAKVHELISSDCLVFPTHYPKECFPLVLLEAMQCGLACISTAEAGIPDIIEDGKTGIIVPPSNPETLADAIEKVVSNKLLCEQMGKHGRRCYELQFTLNVFESNICKMLNDNIQHSKTS
jgi:glycosyltransferase involved in cell wall biosynthesis